MSISVIVDSKGWNDGGRTICTFYGRCVATASVNGVSINVGVELNTRMESGEIHYHSDLKTQAEEKALRYLGLLLGVRT